MARRIHRSQHPCDLGRAVALSGAAGEPRRRADGGLHQPDDPTVAPPAAGGPGHPISVLDQRGQLLQALKTVVGSGRCALFLGACAIANTPQQDLDYARWAKCNSSFPVVLERVDLDGRITFWLSDGRSQEVLQCLVAAAGGCA